MIDLVEYAKPLSFEELWSCFDTAPSPTFVSAGCTDLIPKSRARLIPKATWIDVRHIPELTIFEQTDDSFLLGACLTHHQVSAHDAIKHELPALAAACRSVGSRQIRSLGTLGGNAANCSPCADSFLALVALDAEVVLRSRGGTRCVAVTEFARGPGETILEDQEIIEAFRVPRRAGRLSTFLKLGPRRAVAVAKVSVAASATFKNGLFADVRLALGSVAPTVVRVREAETLIEGKGLETTLLHEIGRLVEDAVKPIDDVRSTAQYRRITSGVLARRALMNLASGD